MLLPPSKLRSLLNLPKGLRNAFAHSPLISSQAFFRIDSENAIEHTTSWGEYFGFYRPTVTVTSIKIEPTTVVDSRVMVTYDIRGIRKKTPRKHSLLTRLKNAGCKPHSLPFDLPKCIEDSVEEVISTTPVATQITASKLVVAGRSLEAEEIEGSETVLEALEPQATTQTL